MKTNRAVRLFAGEFLFFLHIPIFVLWVALFFVPQSVWTGRVAFHFYYIMSIIVAEIVCGLIYVPIVKSFDIICPLTLLVQVLRGFRYDDPSAYHVSFIVELFERFHIRIPKSIITILIAVTSLLVSAQFFWGRPFVF